MRSMRSNEEFMEQLSALQSGSLGTGKSLSFIRTRTDAYVALEADSVEKLIRTTNARPRRAGLPRSGSRWAIRGGLGW